MAADPAPPDPWHWPAGPHRRREPVSLLRLEGPDTLRVLHGQTSQAIEGARPGSWLATCCISPTARLRALAEVLVEANGAHLVIRAGDGAAVRMALDRVLFPADRVTLGELQEGVLVEAVDGSRAKAAGGSGQGAGDSGATWSEVADGGWRLGTRIAVLPAGASLPAALAALPELDGNGTEHWRIQQGLPAAPGELNDDTNPFELGLAARVSLSKGCYVGQETLARLATYDGVKQQLRRWIWRPPAAMPPTVMPPAAERDPVAALQPGQPLLTPAGERAGRITSCLALPAAAGGPLVIGLALVRRSALEEPELHAGESALAIQLSLPAAFEPPPVGAGR